MMPLLYAAYDAIAFDAADTDAALFRCRAADTCRCHLFRRYFRHAALRRDYAFRFRHASCRYAMLLISPLSDASAALLRLLSFRS